MIDHTGTIETTGTIHSALTRAQREIWLFEQLHPGTAVFNLCLAVRQHGPLDRARFSAAAAAVLDHHPALRSTFRDSHDGPVREVLPMPSGTTAQWADLSNLGAGERDAAARSRAKGAAAEPFDLARGPLTRALVCRLDKDEHLLVLVAHHLVCDGASLRIVLADLDCAYRLGALPGTCRDVLTANVPTADERADGDLEYWRERLAGLPALDLPVDQLPGARRSFRAGSVPIAIGPEVTAAAERLAREERATLFVVLVAAFQLVLGRQSGQDDFAIGVPEAGRSGAGTRDVVGLFVNRLALRADLSGRPTFRELLRRARADTAGALAHRRSPFGEVAATLGVGAADLLQAYLVFHGAFGDPTLAGAPLAPVALERAAVQHDVEVHLWRRPDGLWGSWDFSADRFDPTIARWMANRLGVVLEAVLRDPDAPLDRLDVRTEQERQLLAAWATGPTPAVPEQAHALHHLVAAQAVRTPDAIAVSDGRVRLTYRELLDRSRQMAHHLGGRGVVPGAVVAIELPRSADLLVAMLGVLTAGAAYVPVDPAYPTDRVEHMQRDAGVTYVVDAVDGAALDVEPTFDPAIPLQPDDLAYVLYTSGSAGRPKGVMITHRSVVALMGWGACEFTPEQSRRVLAATSVSFDVSVFELFHPLCTGGEVVVVDSPLALLACDAPDVTMVSMVPTVARELAVAGALPPSVRVVNIGGEALTDSVLEQLHAGGGLEAVYNLYGPTEDTTYSTYARLVPGQRSTIGGPLAGERVHLLDADLRPLPVGAVGEIYLAGLGLGLGYIGQPALTAAWFVADPFALKPGARLYRTGDLARYRADGALVYLGRRDFQVKVRGHRIELGEVEAALQRYPLVRDAVVVVHNEQLVGYVLADDPAGVDVEELRVFLAKSLPASMVPGTFAMLDALPRTASGKVDRRALPAPTRALSAGGDRPRGPAEELVAEVWCEVLGVETIGRDDDFFDLGGHSLLATQVFNRLRRRVGDELDLLVVLRHTRLAALAAALPVRTADRPAAPAFPAVRPAAEPENATASDGTRIAAATPGQETLWFFSGLQGAADRAWVVQGALRLTGDLQPDLLAAALAHVVERHGALRTTFAEDGSGLRQVVHEVSTVRLEQVELPNEAAVAELAESVVHFDLVTGPLLRVHLAALGAGRHVLLLTAHHIVIDGWSLSVLGAELSESYAALLQERAPALPDLPVQFAEFADEQRAALRSGAFAGELAYWRTHLAGLTSLDLTTDRVRPPRPSHFGALVSRRVPAGVVERLREIGVRHHVTPYVLLLSVFLILLRRHSGQHDIAVGTPAAGRARAELEPLIGFLLNTVIVRAEVRDDESFAELLSRVRTAAHEALAHQEVPLEAVLAELDIDRDPSRTPLFQVVFNYLNQPPARFRAPGLTVEELPTARPTAKFDLELYVEDHPDGTELTLVYGADLFHADTASAMLDRYLAVLKQIAEDPQQPVGALRMITPRTDDRPAAPSGRANGDDTIGSRFAARVARHPHRIALWTPQTTMTYRELDLRARTLASALHEHVPGPAARIAILCAQDVNVPIAMMGVLAAGAAYVPLDVNAPRARLAEHLTATGAGAVLTDTQNRSLAEDIANGRPVLDVAEASTSNREPIPNWFPVDPDTPAYVLFTSGSTGEAKGVVQTLRNVTALTVNYLTALDVDASDRLTLLCTYIHDGAGQDLYSAMLTGATSCPMDLRGDGVEAVRELLAQAEPTVYHSTPTAFRRLAAAIDATAWPDSLRTVALGGEKLTVHDVNLVRRELPGRRIVNIYGLTECSVTHMYVIEPNDPTFRDPVPIGHPMPGVLMDLLDDEGHSTELSGELVLGGPLMTPGYLDPTHTAAAFSDSTLGRTYRTGDIARRLPDGALQLAGRRDGQVKLRGHRVEVGEVETRLRALPGVTDAVVVPVPDPDGELQLAAYVTGHAEPADVRAALYTVLPHYMVPKAVVVLQQLPTTGSGKLHLGKLPPLDWAAASGSEPPQTPIEQAFADIIGAELGRASVGRQDNFFDLGGESLTAARVVARLREVLDIEVSVRQIFELGTVEKLAAVLTPAGDAIPRRPADAAPVLSFDQQRLWLEHQLKPAATYNVHGRRRLLGELDVTAFDRSVAAIIARHETLRTRFPIVDGEPTQVVDEPDAGWRMTVVDLTGELMGGEDRDAAALRLADEQLATQFDLARGPLLQVLLVRLGDGDHLLSVTIHHIVADAWSIGLFLRELSALYQAGGDPHRADLPALPVQYQDFASWQRELLTGDALAERVDYWRDHLAGAPPALALPTAARRSPTQGVVGENISMRLNPERTADLRRLCREYGVTVFMALSAALATVLHRWTGQDDIVLGVPVSTRRDSGTNNLIGCFVNTVPMRLNVGGDRPFAALLEHVRDVALEGYVEHGDMPFDLLVRELQVPRDPTRTPLFQVLLNMVDDAEAQWRLPGVTAAAVDIPPLPGKFDLTLNVLNASTTLDVDLVFHRDRYDTALMRALLDQLETLLAAVAEDPARAVRDHPLADHLLGNCPPADAATRRPATAVHVDIAGRARRSPDSPALLDHYGWWSYDQLHRAGVRVAEILAASDGTGEVGVIDRPGAGFAAAVLGCSMAGRRYAVLEPISSAAALPYVSVVLDPDPDGAPQERTVDVCSLFIGAPRVDADPTAANRIAVLSGAPGRFAAALAHSAAEGTILLVPDAVLVENPDRTVAWLVEHVATAVQLTAPQLRAITAEVVLPALRLVVLDHGGDLLFADVARARALAPAAQVVGRYGDARGGEILSEFPVGDVTDPATAPLRVPIGALGPDRPLAVRTGSGAATAVGEIGELYLGGQPTGDRGRALPDGTVEFVPDAGTFAAVEHADPLDATATLRDLPGVLDAIVTEYVDDLGEAVPIAYLAGDEELIDLGQLRQHVTAWLPDYLIPQRVVVLERLPLTPTGDYDLAKLPEVYEDNKYGYVGPRTPTEAWLVAIFEELLGVERVSVHDTFFELNGFSLLATQLTSRIREASQVELSLRQVFQSPTVEGLAELIVASQLESVDAAAVEALLAELE